MEKNLWSNQLHLWTNHVCVYFYEGKNPGKKCNCEVGLENRLYIYKVTNCLPMVAWIENTDLLNNLKDISGIGGVNLGKDFEKISEPRAGNESVVQCKRHVIERGIVNKLYEE